MRCAQAFIARFVSDGTLKMFAHLVLLAEGDKLGKLWRQDLFEGTGLSSLP